jgi:hypothetical protein
LLDYFEEDGVAPGKEDVPRRRLPSGSSLRARRPIQGRQSSVSRALLAAHREGAGGDFEIHVLT